MLGYSFCSVLQMSRGRPTMGDVLGMLFQSVPIISDLETYNAFAFSIRMYHKPQYAIIRSSLMDGSTGHAMIIYGVYGKQLYVCDPNYPGDQQRRIILNALFFDPYYSGRDANGVWTVGVVIWPWPYTEWQHFGKVLDIGAPGTWDSQMVRDPSVIYNEATDTLMMWYAGTSSWPVFKIGYAESTDGLNWTKSGSNPVFSGTPGGWDGFQVYAPSVVWDGSTYHMFFSGTDDKMSARWSTGHATSSDGTAWTETARNPILVSDGPGDSLDYVGAMLDNGTWKLWYSYGGAYAIGLAQQARGKGDADSRRRRRFAAVGAGARRGNEPDEREPHHAGLQALAHGVSR